MLFLEDELRYCACILSYVDEVMIGVVTQLFAVFGGSTSIYSADQIHALLARSSYVRRFLLLMLLPRANEEPLESPTTAARPLPSLQSLGRHAVVLLARHITQHA